MQRAIGGIGIALANRIDDLNMLLIAEVIVLMQLFCGHRGASGNQPVQQGNMDRQKDRITGDFSQYAMEFNIGRINSALSSSD